ncbi:tRNA (adenosine(37)-N6)-threonylcarbamoyltransferase complex dimerization subunit type 1 TsaB [Patescibacteria group bacterium]|nr:tRNA (adenosine(37)-N6)-threonylcarbamoyltransferase complex dimerization subunit type 1 TsaB [Patescibacteria group bacterium]MBU1672919.1 tRNA (adenosine(37)-N6)-threonylcarbamoyltransferase complex dimerization subunit type 1 TsaB [Patescibacteria group bacterium]MBU1963390.1 tRNA (adenosine(37)-N6)-threonylcarbamoyltransferase complex dimerization subunit type 1 TsaB [Patescibacteria group bacterium]
MFLIIENSKPDKAILALAEDGKIVSKIIKKRQFHESENLLEYIDDLFKEKKIKVRDLEGIIVVIGPGSFTAVRVACVIANTMAYVEKVPLYGFKQAEYNKLEDLLKKIKTRKEKSYLEPFYGKRPNISKSKKKK